MRFVNAFTFDMIWSLFFPGLVTFFVLLCLRLLPEDERKNRILDTGEKK